MPYIPQRHRYTLATNEVRASSGGELNYQITHLMHTYVLHNGISYQTLSDARSAAINAADEFYRVVIAPYEDKKRQENGHISELDKPENIPEPRPQKVGLSWL